jgi:hypothetical protein
MRYRLQGSVTIPRKPTTLGGIVAWAKGVNRALAELRDRKIVGSESQRNTNSQPPFFPTLSGDATEGYKLTMKKGWVSSTHWKYGVQSVATIEVTSIPGDPDPVANALTVASGSKIYATLTENVYGEITAAAIESGSSWPTSDAAQLIGGDDQAGTEGTRYVRLCEVVTVDGNVRVKVIHTGNIEHSAPTLCENTNVSPSGGEARVLKVWNASAGRWDLRTLIQGDGITITETADTIEISATDYTGPGWWGSIEYQYHSASGSLETDIVLRFENGRLITVGQDGEDVEGTDENLGAAYFFVYDT